MGETAVKICGLQDVEVLKSMVNLPVDYIGFVFAPSRRRVTPEQAALLAAQLKAWQTPEIPQSVGVFVNPDLEELAAIMDQAQLDVVQLHGQESPQFCREVKERLGTRVFKVLSVQSLNENSEASINHERYAGVIDGLLLDTFDPVYGGGSGSTFAWEEIPAYRDWARTQGIPLFVAGGLLPSNVAELINKYSPDGVDVSSGVESDGVKDIDKIAAFVGRVKQA
ncbi:phosphoribosylanthranilate isomerase [Paenibacillus rhizosphaerae]|uniref:N-(5'-phosphoribosyl)anthranilate isomerase n=1 Tax=Paenibacillus rhizosphaerae TaxID=297318 RepID=A0A839TLX1_9BACL|nr:phosphoribosylanthranilate isomerase [Paenibacillus rhizosphaerae]MBB3127672.1 phosphoribosylanthranilate isomerase [Paenibacillus rhizosphaerae]